MPDEPQWPTEDDDAEPGVVPEGPTLQVSRPSLDQPTMRLPIAPVLAPPSTQEPLRSSPVRSAPNGAGSAARASGVPLQGSGGPAGGSSGGKSHGQVGPDGGQPRQVEPPRAAPMRISPGAEATPVAAKTARVDQLPVSEPSWFDQSVRPESQAPRPQPPRHEPLRQERVQQAAPPRQEPLRQERVEQAPPPRQEEPVRETLPVSGYDEEPEDRLTGSDEPKKGRKPLVVVLGLLVVAALAGATLYAVDEFGGPAAVEIKPPAPPAAVQPLVKAVTAGGPAPSPAGVKSVLAGPAGNSALGTLTGSVVDPANGTVLWQQGDTTAATPASSLKILTAAAALLSLEKTDQLSTKVVQGAEPGTVVIVGGGDPTISGTPGSSVYPGAAALDDLVNQVKQKGQVTKVQFDLSRYTGEALGPQWETADIAGGSVAPIVPFMLDGGRLNPKNDVSARTGSPAQSAADAFAQRIGAPGATPGTAVQGAQVLGEIKSAPIEQLVDNMMQISDNVLTEAIAREVAIKTGNEPSFAGGVKAVRDVLTKNGFDLTGANFVDGSGLSATNKIPAKLLTDVLATAAKPTLDDPRTAKLRPLLTALPVAGGSGTLAGRYGGSASGGKGWVRAKTGTLTGVNALAGVVVDVDGRVLVFSFMSASNRNPELEVRPALDVMAAALRGCGCS
ncbi:D-alanyl-D-alanine carboxypeptidase/D-alanyl-D-alanine endopeptidase [Lentzea roselyniae]